MNTHNIRQGIASVVLSTFVVLTMAPAASFASVKGRRNTAIGLTAGALYSAIRGKTGAAVVLGGGAAYAWKRHNDERRQQAYQRNYYGRGPDYNNHYGNAYGRTHYHSYHHYSQHHHKRYHQQTSS